MSTLDTKKRTAPTNKTDESQDAGLRHRLASTSNQVNLSLMGLDPTRGTDKNLPDEMQAKLERHFGYNLDSLRIKESTEASKLGGKAFTQGSLIHLNPGILGGRDSLGEKIIAHEVSHAVSQATSGRSYADTPGVIVDPRSERAADKSADSFLSGGMEMSESTATLSHLPTAPANAPAEGWGFRNLRANKDRGHDIIMPAAAAKANAALAATPALGGQQYSAEDMQNMDRGTFFNDIGPHSFDHTYADGKAAPGTMRQIKFGAKFALGMDKSSFVHQTHEGNLQFLHGMKSGNDRDQLDTNRKLNMYARLAYGLGSGQNPATEGHSAIGLDTKVGDLADSEFADLGFQHVSDFYKNRDMRTAMRVRAKHAEKLDQFAARERSGETLSSRDIRRKKRSPQNWPRRTRK